MRSVAALLTLLAHLSFVFHSGVRFRSNYWPQAECVCVNCCTTVACVQCTLSENVIDDDVMLMMMMMIMMM